jgi:hypothetical protein
VREIRKSAAGLAIFSFLVLANFKRRGDFHAIPTRFNVSCCILFSSHDEISFWIRLSEAVPILFGRTLRVQICSNADLAAVTTVFTCVIWFKEFSIDFVWKISIAMARPGFFVCYFFFYSLSSTQPGFEPPLPSLTLRVLFFFSQRRLLDRQESAPSTKC